MRIMGSSEVAHWGQCFEEFYGQNYCKYLRKDLEKLKDEFYDGNSQRFQLEWVLPTVNLLRRLRQMGFPIRTQAHIIIHLYNPVDSMAAGETHFQVGRQAPGTLTLKFTKQNNDGVFVIQPKTLSNKDEIVLNDDPIDFFNKVRLEMKGSCLNTTTLLHTLVLMTDNCKLERQSVKAVFFSYRKVKNVGQLDLNVQDRPSYNPPASSSVSHNPSKMDVPQQGAFVACGVGPGRRSSDSNYPVPWSFCVKNYVSYNGQKPSLEVTMPGCSSGVACFSQREESILRPENLGALYRQARSTTWHSEPEENDETMDLYSMNEMPSDVTGGCKTDVTEELRRSMADAKLWDPPVKVPSSHTEQVAKMASDCAWMPQERGGHKAGSRVNSMVRSIPNYNVQANGSGMFFRYEHEMANDSSLYQPSMLANRFLTPNDLQRRYSEPRAFNVSEYTAQCTVPVLDNVPGLKRPIPPNVSRGGRPGESECLVDRRNSTPERTSLTEEYAGHDSEANNEREFLKGTFSDAVPAMLAAGTSGTGSRTGVVDDYTGWNRGSHQNVYPTSFDNSICEETGQATQKECDGRRTSSLDAYIGNNDAASRTLRDCTKAKSDCGLHAVQRTNVVNEYFHESRDRPEVWHGHVSADRDSSAPNESSLLTNLNVPNISLLYKEINSGVRTSIDSQLSESAVSWASHKPLGGGYVSGSSLDPQCEAVLSHDSFPSWGSHHVCESVPSSTVLLPVTIDEISRNAQCYQESSATSS